MRPDHRAAVFDLHLGKPARERLFSIGQFNIPRVKPEQKVVHVAFEQTLWLDFYAPSQLEWQAALDGAYGNREFFAPLQDKAVQVIARTRCDGVFVHQATADQYVDEAVTRFLARTFTAKTNRIGANRMKT